MSRAAAVWIAAHARKSVQERGVFTLVLSGGKTPRRLYGELAGPSFGGVIPWDKIQFFWGDERCVPPDHPYSNYALAWETFLSIIPAPPDNIHRMPAELRPPEQAAMAYELTLRDMFPKLEHKGHGERAAEGAARFPSFDLVLLGMGNDGHTASLLPGDPALEERDRWVVVVAGQNADPPVPRITMTLPLINEAQCVLFLISGNKKKIILQTILRDPEGAKRFYPAAWVRPKGRVIWFTA